MEKKCFFSIIIPVYNVEKYLKKCLSCLISQTFPNFEAIFVDDESTDNSLSILREIEKKDSRFKVISKKNEGPGVARNLGLKVSSGEYIIFLDPDDWIEDSALQVLFNEFNKTKAQVIQFDYKKCFEPSKKIELASLNRDSKVSIQDNSFFDCNIIKNKSLSDYRLMVWDKAYCAQFIKDNKIRFAPNKHGEDHIFSLKVLFLAKKILYINKYLYNYLTRENSASNKKSLDNFCIFDNICALEKILDENNFLNEFNKEFLQYKMNVLKWHYNAIPEDKKEEYLKQCQLILSNKNYKKLTKQIKNRDRTFIEQIFSIKNICNNTKKTKIITIFGFEFILEKNKEKNFGI